MVKVSCPFIVVVCGSLIAWPTTVISFSQLYLQSFIFLQNRNHSVKRQSYPNNMDDRLSIVSHMLYFITSLVPIISVKHSHLKSWVLHLKKNGIENFDLKVVQDHMGWILTCALALPYAPDHAPWKVLLLVTTTCSAFKPRNHDRIYIYQGIRSRWNFNDQSLCEFWARPRVLIFFIMALPVLGPKCRTIKMNDPDRFEPGRRRYSQVMLSLSLMRVLIKIHNLMF